MSVWGEKRSHRPILQGLNKFKCPYCVIASCYVFLCRKTLARNFIYLMHSFFSTKSRLPEHLSLLPHLIFVWNWTILRMKKQEKAQLYLLSVLNIRTFSWVHAAPSSWVEVAQTWAFLSIAGNQENIKYVMFMSIWFTGLPVWFTLRLYSV